MGRKIRKRQGFIIALVSILVLAVLVAVTERPSASSITFSVNQSVAADSPNGSADPCSPGTHEPQNITGNMNPQIANYDKQVWGIFGQDAISMIYNVSAVEQTDASGYGPAYLLNGYTDKGYWYQVGIAWHWLTRSNVGYYDGFSFFVQVYNSNSNDAQLVNILSPIFINGGDKVELRMSISSVADQVTMGVHDWATGAMNQNRTAAYGASHFVGDLSNTRNPTSLLIEAYGRNFVCGLDRTTFSSSSASPPIGVRIDEWNFTGVAVQDRFNGNPQWSDPPNGQGPQGSLDSCLVFLGTTACVSGH
jgi:hypothetical protein